MRSIVAIALLLSFACTPPPITSDLPKQEAGPKVDAYGDPLPPGVLARFGTSRLTHTGGIEAAAVHPSGKIVATLHWDICLWDLERGTLIRRMLAPRDPDDIFPGGPREAVFHPDGRRLVAWGSGREIYLFDIETGACVKQLTFDKRRNECLDFAKDPERILVGHDDGTVTLATLATGEVHRRFKTCGDTVKKVRLHPDGRRFFVAGGSDDPKLRLWSLESGEEEAVFPGEVHDPKKLLLTDDGKHLVTGRYKELLVFDVGKRSVVGRKEFEEQYLISLDVLPGRNELLTGHYRGIVREWALPDLRLIRETATDSPCSNFVPLPPEGERLLSWKGDGFFSGGPRLQLSARRSGGALPPLASEHRSGITTIDVSPDGRWIASGSQDGTIRIEEVSTSRTRKVLRSPTGAVGAVTFLPGGKKLASVGLKDSRIRVWDLFTGDQTKTIVVPGDDPHEINLLVWVSDGTRVVCERNGRLWAIDLESGAVARTVSVPGRIDSPESVHDLLRDAANPEIVYVAMDSGVSVWDTRLDKWAASHRQSKPRRVLQSPFLPPDSLLTSGYEQHVLLNLKQQKPRSFELEFARSLSDTVMAMSPQGSRLAVAHPSQYLGPFSFERGAKLQIRDLRTKRPILELTGHDAEITHIRWLDERRVLTASRDLTLMIWEVRLTPSAEARKRAEEIGTIDALIAPLGQEGLDKRIGAEEVLVALGDRSVGALSKRISLCGASQEKQAPAIIRACRDLGDADPVVRERAQRKLRESGLDAVLPLREATSSPDPEVRVRSQALLDLMWTRTPDEVWRAGLTCVDLLEWIGTPAAIEALREAAADPRLLWVSDAARDAIRRLRP